MKDKKKNLSVLLGWLFGLTLANFSLRLLTAYILGVYFDLNHYWERIYYVIPRIEFFTFDEEVFRLVSTVSLLVPAVVFAFMYFLKAFKIYKLKNPKDELWKLLILMVFVLINLTQYVLAIFIDDSPEYETSIIGLIVVAVFAVYAWFVYTRIEKKCKNLQN